MPSRRLAAIGGHLRARAGAANAASAAGPQQAGAGGILDGVTVVEMSMVLAAPMACALMADMGATVLKIEPPQGEIWRRDGPPEQFQQCAPQRRAAPGPPSLTRCVSLRTSG